MDLQFGDWVLVDGKYEAFVYRADHFGDENFAFLTMMSVGINQRYVPKSRLTKLDPVLYPFLESEYEKLKSRRS